MRMKRKDDFQKLQIISFHSVVENAKLRREKFKCLLIKEQSLCCLSHLFNIEILPPDEASMGDPYANTLKLKGFWQIDLGPRSLHVGMPHDSFLHLGADI